MKYLPHISSGLGLIFAGIAIYLAVQNNNKNKQIAALMAENKKLKDASVAPAAATSSAPVV